MIMSAVLTLTVWLPSPARMLDTPTKLIPTYVSVRGGERFSMHTEKCRTTHATMPP